MSIRFWLASASMVAGYALVSSGAGCLVVSNSSGTGGTGSVSTSTTVQPMSTAGVGGSGGTSGVTTTGMMSSTGTGMCKESGTDHCHSCVNPPYGCGVASTNATLLVCDFNAGNKNSLDLYTDLFDCLCGSDGGGGYCGADCSKTCKGTGTDTGNCQTCLASAFTSAAKCSAQYQSCNKD